MEVAIITKSGCPLCEIAVREFARDRRSEIIHAAGLDSFPATVRRRMIADMVAAGGDVNAFPQVFVDGKYIDWKPAGTGPAGKELKDDWNHF